MNFKNLSDPEKIKFAEMLLNPISNPQELKDWVMLFLDLDLPYGHVDEESGSDPIDAIWSIYETFKLNKGDKNPGFILLSCRAGYKTSSIAVLEILLMLHFRLDIAHMAAIESQSSVCLKYISQGFLKIEPLLTAAGWENTSQNKRTIEYTTPDRQEVFIKVIIATPKGANALHSNVLVLDELDLADEDAVEESKYVPVYSKGIHPVKIVLSTRKYAFGLMNKEIDRINETRYKLLRWNILDITEKCHITRHKPELPKEDRYVSKSLPLKQLSTDEYNTLSEAEKTKFSLIPQAYAGCASCPLLPVCKTNLAHRPEDNVGGFYKPIDSVIQQFKESEPDKAEAQLLCWKPGSEGLVYPRFSTELNKGNVISLAKAYETLIGLEKKDISELDLILAMQNANIRFFAGVDWGYDHDFVIIVIALIPNGEVWVMDCYASPGLEFADQLEVAKSFRDKYKIERWFCDTAMPSHLKTFNKNGMKSPNFTKDVLGGIESIRAKITDGFGRKWLKVLYTDNNKKVMSAITRHRFKIDGQGNVTVNPDDERGVADVCDALRYIGQNLFPIRGPLKPMATWTEEQKKQAINPVAEEQMKEEIAKRVVGGPASGGNGKKGGFFWSM